MPEPDRGARPGESGAADEPACACVSDPFVSLPPELRPRTKRPAGGLRKTVCPACGLDYWTNRATDRCIACEAAGR